MRLVALRCSRCKDERGPKTWMRERDVTTACGAVLAGSEGDCAISAVVVP